MLSVAVVVLAIVAAVLQLNAWLVALSIVAAVVARIVSTERETKTARAEHIKRQLDELYAPWAKVAKARLERAASDYSQRFQQHMTSELGELHRHLAEPATLAAYDLIVREGRWGGDAEVALARVFLDDHRRLVDVYRHLAGTLP